MTGMKKGAGEDPFADDDSESGTDSGESTDAGNATDPGEAESATSAADPAPPGESRETGGSGGATDSTGPADAASTPDSTGPESRPEGGADVAGSDAGSGPGGGSNQPAVRIPYKFRRDGVQDGRNRVPLFVQSDTQRAERNALRELEERFDDDVSLTDLREALVKVGLQHLTQVESQLEEWGYGMTFEE